MAQDWLDRSEAAQTVAKAAQNLVQEKRDVAAKILADKLNASNVQFSERSAAGAESAGTKG